MNDELLTTYQAAKILGVTPDMIRKYRRHHGLAAVESVRGYLFRKADLETFVKPPRVGRRGRQPRATIVSGGESST